MKTPKPIRRVSLSEEGGNPIFVLDLSTVASMGRSQGKDGDVLWIVHKNNPIPVTLSFPVSPNAYLILLNEFRGYLENLDDLNK